MPISGTHHHIELAFEASASLHELYIALLIGEGIEYFQEEDNRLLAYLPETEWTEEREQSIRTLLKERLHTKEK